MQDKELKDRLELRALVDQIAVLADEKAYLSQAELFTRDVLIEITVNGNVIMKLEGRQTLPDAFSDFNKSFKDTFHLNGQQTLEIRGDRAEGILYCYITLISSVKNEETRSILLAIYKDEFVRENDAWLLSKRRGKFIWQE